MWPPDCSLPTPFSRDSPGHGKETVCTAGPLLRTLLNARLSVCFPHPAGALESPLHVVWQQPKSHLHVAHSFWCRESCSPRELMSEVYVKATLCMCNMEELSLII